MPRHSPPRDGKGVTHGKRVIGGPNIQILAPNFSLSPVSILKCPAQVGAGRAVISHEKVRSEGALCPRTSWGLAVPVGGKGIDFRRCIGTSAGAPSQPGASVLTV